MTTKKNDVTEAPSGALAAPIDFGEMGGGGGDSLKPKDLTIPAIEVLQSSSPQLNKNESVYHPDAAAGLLFLTAANDVRDPELGLIYVPIRKTDHVEERTPKDPQSGGKSKFVALHAPDSPIVKEAMARAVKDPAQASEKHKRLYTPAGNLLRDCVYLWGYTMANDAATDPEGVAVIKITSSKFKPFRMQLANPLKKFQEDTGKGDPLKGVPFWGVRIRIGTFQDKDPKSGGLYWNLTFAPAAGAGKWKESMILPVRDEAGGYTRPYLFGAEINKRIISGEMRVDQVASSDDDSTGDEAPAATAGF